MRILVFSAHAADYCSRSGGTLAKYTRQGDEVRVICLTHGERSESSGLYTPQQRPSLDEVRAIRRGDAERAAKILGVDLRLLGWDDLLFEYTHERVVRLADQIRAFQPRVVLTHHGPDPRSVDHDTTWQLVSRAVQMAAAPGLESEHPVARGVELFLFEATVPLTEVEGFSPDAYVDITDVWDTKVRALEQFAPAQSFLVAWYADVARRRAFQAARLCGRPGIEYAEAYERTAPWVGRALPLCED